MEASYVIELVNANHVQELYEALKKLDDVTRRNVVNSRGPHAVTGLHQACARGLLDMSALLIQAGADLFVFDQNGNSPLDLASVGGFAPVVHLLLHYAASNPVITASYCSKSLNFAQSRINRLIQYEKSGQRCDPGFLVEISTVVSSISTFLLQRPETKNDPSLDTIRHLTDRGRSKDALLDVDELEDLADLLGKLKV